MPGGTFFHGKVLYYIYIYMHSSYSHSDEIFSIEEDGVTQAISLSIITSWDLDAEHLNDLNT